MLGNRTWLPRSLEECSIGEFRAAFVHNQTNPNWNCQVVHGDISMKNYILHFRYMLFL